MPDPEYLPQRPSLVGPRLKLDRAREHLEELNPKIRAYVKRRPYVISDEREAEGEWMIVRWGDVREHPDPCWGVRAGEFFHNLRSALDNLVWQLVMANGQEPGGHNQFPIYTDHPPGKPRKLLKEVPGATRVDEMLFGVHADHVATIKRLQPYLGLDEERNQRTALGAVVLFNNIDKHKIVHPAVGISERAPKPTLEHVAGPAPVHIDVHHRLGSIYSGAEALRWRIIGGSPDTEVEMKGELRYEIAFGHSNATLAHLDWLREQIGEVIGRFEGAFTARPDQS